jgi:metal-responsive CopG/Arc/MetJ family transcriptional regulator
MTKYMINHNNLRFLHNMNRSLKSTTKTRPTTVTLPGDLLAVVDSYVEAHKEDKVTRTSVIAEGVRMWVQALRDQQDLEYFTNNAEALRADNESWSAITTEAAKEIFG